MSVAVDRRWTLGGVVLLLCLVTPTVSALEAVGVVLGKGMNEALIQSKSIASTEIAGLDLRWQTEWAEWFSWAEVDQTFVNLQLAHWRGEHQGRTDAMDLIALTALWRWQHENSWFADAGVGATRLSDDMHEAVQLSGRNQFALDFAIGKQFDRWQLSLRYRHYSNGYTANPNPGLDGAVLLLDYQF